MIQVLLVEDNHALALTIVDYLSLEDIECDFVANGEAGLAMALKNPYHLLLLDVNLPRMSGLDVCEALRAQGVEVPVLMLTAKDSLADKLAGFDSGTDDYLVKPFEMQELIARIRALAHRRSSQSRKLTLADLVVDLQQKRATRAGRVLDLTPTGWIILETLLRHTPSVVSREVLETAIWQDDLPETDLLKVHLYRLRQQVDRPFDTTLIHTVPNHGVLIRESS